MVRQRKVNGWFVGADLGPVMKAIATTARTDPGRWIQADGTIGCKYVEVRVDMRTGDFVLKNAFGDLLTFDQINQMFPELGEITFVE